MRHSTNALTRRYFEKHGAPVETVQSWRGRVRHDLFGVADTIALLSDGPHFIQNCSYGTLAQHRRTVEAAPHLTRLLDCGRISLFEWRRKKVGRKKLWFLRVQGLTRKGWMEVGPWSGPHELYGKRA